MKKGHWVDLCETFWSGNQVTLRGEYKNWKKSGEWNMMSQRKKLQLYFIINYQNQSLQFIQ
ncbi:unnamed protein product [Paramecium sonneborni]|uniref:Uncharacterized protein n=1 Tax=Paramecium sonneborni TaxID=65129 RepID=A0A8S1RJJ3_9CILI|nr:unnamed protein product [Paramecium sonneborni]